IENFAVERDTEAKVPGESQLGAQSLPGHESSATGLGTGVLEWQRSGAKATRTCHQKQVPPSNAVPAPTMTKSALRLPALSMTSAPATGKTEKFSKTSRLMPMASSEGGSSRTRSDRMNTLIAPSATNN